MEEMSGKVQKANLSCFVLVHVRVDQRRFASNVDVDAATLPSVSTRNAPAGRWNVTYGFDSQEGSPTATTHIAKVSIPVGRWMKCLGTFKGERT